MGAPKDPEKYKIFVEKDRQASIEFWSDPKNKEKQTQRLIKQWKDPEFRAKIEKTYQDPEWKKKRAKQAKKKMEELFLDPAVRKLWSERSKEQRKDPKYMEALEAGLANPDVIKVRSENARAQMLKQWQDPEFRKAMVEKTKRQWKDPEFQRLRVKTARKQMLKLWEDSEYRERTVKRLLTIRSPNKKELLLASILHELDLPYEFVGDGKLIIDGRNPDFTNVDGQKKLIELYGEHFHREEKAENGGDEGKARKDFFQRYGYQTLIVWERELENKETLIKKLIEFEKD